MAELAEICVLKYAFCIIVYAASYTEELYYDYALTLCHKGEDNSLLDPTSPAVLGWKFSLTSENNLRHVLKYKILKSWVQDRAWQSFSRRARCVFVLGLARVTAPLGTDRGSFLVVNRCCRATIKLWLLHIACKRRLKNWDCYWMLCHCSCRKNWGGQHIEEVCDSHELRGLWVGSGLRFRITLTAVAL